MNGKLHIILCSILILTLLLISCSNSDGIKTKSTEPTITDIKDTSFIKSIKWDSLNTFVDFHILHNGTKTTDTNFHFIAKPVAVYHYYNNKYEVIGDSTKLYFKPNELKMFIISDIFSNRTNFDCLLRINTLIWFHYRPDLLRKVAVRAKDMSDKNIHWLISSLKEEIFTDSVYSQIHRDEIFFDDSTETVFINIKLKPDFWDLKKINEVCRQLNNRPDVDTAFFPDFFTGLNESEMIYQLTTDNKSSR